MSGERVAFLLGVLSVVLVSVFIVAWVVGYALWTFGNGDAPSFFLYGTLLLAYVMAASGVLSVALSLAARVRTGALTDDGRAALTFAGLAFALFAVFLIVARLLDLD